MTKAEFLEALRAELASAAADERAAALQYYTEYLDEAGPEREAEVLAELGSPKALAAGILQAGGSEGWAPPADKAARQSAGAGTPPPPNPMDAPPPSWPPPPGYDDAGKPQDIVLPEVVPAQGHSRPAGYNPQHTLVAKIIIGILLLLIAAPVLGGLCAVLIGTLVSVVCLFIVPLIAGVALMVGGVAVIVSGAFLAAVSVPNALVAIGIGVCCSMLGLLSFYGGIRLLGKGLPAIVRGIIGSIRFLWLKFSGFFTGVKSNG